MRYHVAVAAATALGIIACSEPTDISTAPATLPTAAVGVMDTTGQRGRYIVIFRNDVGNPKDLTDTLVRGNGGLVHFRYTNAVKGFAATLPSAALDGIRHNPKVSFVEPDGVVSVIGTTVQTDPPSWGQDRVDQHRLPLDQGYTADFDGNGVRVYIIDTGIRFTHQEYAGRAISGYDFIDNDADASDCHGHGTHVAGTVGGNTAGLAKKATLVAVRVLDCGGSGSYSQVIAGVDWVTQDHIARGTAAVANMSLGGTASSAVNLAVTNSIAAGVVYAVAAGNSGKDACTASPASAPNALTVAATGSNDARASFSNWGTCVDLFAPGVSITSSTMTGDNTYASWSGTSMATPHVAGVAALYLSANRSATPAQVEAAIKTGASVNLVIDPMGSPNLLLYSRIAPPPAPDAPMVDITVDGADGPLTRSAGSIVTISWTSKNVVSCSVSPGNWTGTSGSLSSGPLSASTTYVVSCTGAMANGATDQVEVFVAPTADIKVNGSDEPVTVTSGGEVSITWTSTNAASCKVLPVNWTGASGSVNTSIGGTITFSLTCTGEGGQASDMATVNVPGTQGVTADIKVNGSDGPVTVASGSTATISWSSGLATACTVSPANWTGTSGSKSTGPLTSSVTYAVSCTGYSGTGTDQVVVNVASTAPVVDIKANGSDGPITVASGSAVTIDWNSSNVSSCSVSPGGQTGTSGSTSVGPLTASTTYTVSCTGSGGTATDQVVVNVPSPTPAPAADIKANSSNGPISVTSGTAVTLSWTSSNATSCSVSPGSWTGTSGSQSSGPLSANATYTVSCTGSGGTATDQVIVNVTPATPAPTVDIKANGADGPVTVASGGAVTINWTSSSATSCSVSPGGWTGTSGSQTSGPLSASTTYTVSCTGSGGTATDQVVVNVSPATSTDVHVGNLDGTSSSNGKNWKATVTFQVHTVDHAPVSGATVTFTISGSGSGTVSCVTSSTGSCSYTTGARKNTETSVTFSVTGIAGTGLRYVASSNHDPDSPGSGISSDGSSIVVYRP